MHHPLARRAQALIRAFHTTPGSTADSLGCAMAITGLAIIAYALLVLA